jgi:hypothetical protein
MLLVLSGDDSSAVISAVTVVPTLPSAPSGSWMAVYTSAAALLRTTSLRLQYRELLELRQQTQRLGHRLRSHIALVRIDSSPEAWVVTQGRKALLSKF